MDITFRRHTLLPLDDGLFVAIDRTSKFAVAQLVEKANRQTAWDLLGAYSFAGRLKTLCGFTFTNTSAKLGHQSQIDSF